jgi:hypothetical protein
VDLPPPPFGPGFTRVDFTDNTRSLNIRGGLGWRPSEKFGAYADWQYLRLTNVRIGSNDDSAMSAACSPASSTSPSRSSRCGWAAPSIPTASSP